MGANGPPSQPILGDLHQCEEPQLLCWKRQLGLTHQGFWAVQHDGFLRIEGNQRPLGRGKARGGENPVSDIFHFPIPQVVPAVVFRQKNPVGLMMNCPISWLKHSGDCEF